MGGFGSIKEGEEGEGSLLGVGALSGPCCSVGRLIGSSTPKF